jgi:hypothetical protein
MTIGKTRNAIGAVGNAVVLVAVAAAGLLAVAGCGSSQAPSTGLSATPSSAASASPIDSPTPSPSPTPFVDSAPTPIPAGWVYSDLNGVAAPPELAHRLPLALMIDDNVLARPQAGFSSASIVIQAPADGGEDRYMMIFQEATADDIGPIRSARPYFVYWAAEYKPLYGHYGGDAKSLGQVIPAMKASIYNMDALKSGSCPYHRISERAAPHNAYTKTSELIRCAAKLQYPTTYQKAPTRTFRDNTPYAQRPATQTISIPYHTGTVGYEFDPTTDSYLRSVDGRPQLDAANGQRVTASNVVVMFQSVTIDPASEAGYNRPIVWNVGTGRAVVFVEGQAVDGTWKKTSETALTRFYDGSGQEISLVRGRIFIQSVPAGTALTYR